MKRGHFFKILLYFSITKFDILIFCNILHLEVNLGNVY